MAKKTINILNTAANLPKKITDVTDSISKGATKVHDMTTKMDTALRGVPTYNPVSGAIKGGLTKVTGAIDATAGAAESAANKLNTFGQNVATAITPVATAAKTVSQAITDLQNCQQVVDAASTLVDAIVNSASGHFHPRDLGTAFQNFDDKWDSWARVVNKTFETLSPSGQTNVLMDLAKNNFSPSVIALGSAIKNESAGIFNGIADFEDSIHAFRGSYRDPVQAAKKIETGVKGIINATEKVANSINNMIKTYQNGVGAKATGNPVLSYLGNLHNTPAVSALNKVLTAGGGAATLWSDAGNLAQAWKSKDIKTIYKSAEKTVKDASTIIKGLKDSNAATKTTSLAQNATATSSLTAASGQTATSSLASSSGGSQAAAGGGSAGDGQSASNNGSSGNQQQNQQNKKNDSGGGGASTDSYVCSGATMRCTMGTSQAKLTVLPDRITYLTGKPMANISDHTSFVNLAPFGRCRSLGFPATASATAANHGTLTPMPCMHNTPFPWMGGKLDYIVKGQPALLKTCKCQCMWGGTISLVTDGQTPTGPADMSRKLVEEFEKDQVSAEGLSADEVLDGIQMALDVAGMVPVLGAAPDLINAAISACRGNWADAGISLLAAVPGVGDMAGGTKIVKNGVQIANKVKKGSAMAETGKVLSKSDDVLKNTAKTDINVKGGNNKINVNKSEGHGVQTKEQSVITKTRQGGNNNGMDVKAQGGFHSNPINGHANQPKARTTPAPASPDKVIDLRTAPIRVFHSYNSQPLGMPEMENYNNLGNHNRPEEMPNNDMSNPIKTGKPQQKYNELPREDSQLGDHNKEDDKFSDVVMSDGIIRPSSPNPNTSGNSHGSFQNNHQKSTETEEEEYERLSEKLNNGSISYAERKRLEELEKILYERLRNVKDLTHEQAKLAKKIYERLYNERHFTPEQNAMFQDLQKRIGDSSYRGEIHKLDNGEGYPLKPTLDNLNGMGIPYHNAKEEESQIVLEGQATINVDEDGKEIEITEDDYKNLIKKLENDETLTQREQDIMRSWNPGWNPN